MATCSLLLDLTLLLLFVSGARPEPCPSSSCRLPDCYCPGRRGPLPPSQTPQMVMVAFDDYVNAHFLQSYYMKLFNGRRTNPNGCPIAATYYVSDAGGNNYQLVRELHLSGHEVGDHSVTHRMPQSWWASATVEEWRKELGEQLDNLVNLGRVPRREVRGTRAPFLELGADRQFQVISELGFRYDSSFMTGPYTEDPANPYTPAWPFTLDYKLSGFEFCDSRNCPAARYPGLWEMPLNRWMGLDHKACSMMDGCQESGVDKADIVRYMKQNFNRHYNGNRAPFGVFLHPVWFDRGANRFAAMVDFIDDLLTKPDVYLVTVNQALDWMQSPTNISEIKDFAPWRTNCAKKKIHVETGTPPTGGASTARLTAGGILTSILTFYVCLGAYGRIASL